MRKRSEKGGSREREGREKERSQREIKRERERENMLYCLINVILSIKKLASQSDLWTLL